METVTFNAKEIIFREGDLGDAAYIVKDGAVEILKHAEHGEVQLAVLERGGLFGEMAILYPRDVRSASVRALTQTTLEVISPDTLEGLLENCEPQVISLLYNLFGRLREMNQRLAAKERATTTLDNSIDKITIHPASDALEGMFDPIEIHAANLPFSIGGYAKNGEAHGENDMEIPCDGPPLIVSQKHLRIERQDDGVYIVDQGSRFCTIVNSKAIGRGKADTKAQLQLGENKITLGEYDSPYKLLIVAQ